MKYLRRGIWYLATRLMVVCLIAGLVITVFYYAYNLANIQIILKDGMATRAKCILGISTDEKMLDRYFQNGEAVLPDEDTEGNVYDDYNVRGIDHRLDMDFMWVWPWENKATVTITESIPRIDGRVKGTRADEVIARNGANAVYPPAWEEVSYRAVLEKSGGQWKIKSLTQVSR